MQEMERGGTGWGWMGGVEGRGSAGVGQGSEKGEGKEGAWNWVEQGEVDWSKKGKSRCKRETGRCTRKLMQELCKQALGL